MGDTDDEMYKTKHSHLKIHFETPGAAQVESLNKLAIGRGVTAKQNIPDREVVSLTSILPSREKANVIGVCSACRNTVDQRQSQSKERALLSMSRLLSLAISTSHGSRMLLTF